MTRCVSQALHDYAMTGGDIGNVIITVAASPNGHVRGTSVTLQGWRA